MRENVIDKIIEKELNYYKKLGICWYTKKHANRYQQSGVPDFLGCYKGVFFAIEAKAGNGHNVSMAQLFNGYKIAQSGGIFIIAFSDYKSIPETPVKKANLKLQADKANKLSDKEYDELENIFNEINHEKKSILLEL